MPTTITDDDALFDPLIVPSDSDPPLASGYLKAAFQIIANRTAHLLHRIGLLEVKPWIPAAGYDKAATPTPSSFTGAGWGDITAPEFSVSGILGGDRLMVRATGMMMAPTAEVGKARLRVVAPGAVEFLSMEAQHTGAASNNSVPFAVTVHATCANSGTATINLQGLASVSGVELSQVAIEYTLMRNP